MKIPGPTPIVPPVAPLPQMGKDQHPGYSEEQHNKSGQAIFSRGHPNLASGDPSLILEAACPMGLDPVEWERMKRDNLMGVLEKEQQAIYELACETGDVSFQAPVEKPCPKGVDPLEWERLQSENLIAAMNRLRRTAINAYLAAQPPLPEMDADEDQWPLDPREIDTGREDMEADIDADIP